VIRSGFGFAAVIVIAAVVVYSYKYIDEQQLISECKGDKKALRKKKRGSLYTNLIDGETTSSSLPWYKRSTQKTWASDSETPY
jgi:hypothetical protein